jgi:hypothetical protein
VQWVTLPSAYKSELLTALEATLPTLNNREVSNVFWALGKTNINYNEHLSTSFRETLTSCLVGDVGDMKLFDLESIFVGLGLMQVSHAQSHLDSNKWEDDKIREDIAFHSKFVTSPST